MSNYYDPSKPLSLENWNSLIRDVNEILQNPPAGTDCQPVSTLDEVSDPHLWSVQDVERVRQKLQATCPNISFREPLIIWRQSIIDEIDEKMAQAWCNCQPEGHPETVTTTITDVQWTLMKAAASSGACCDTVVQASPCVLCVGQHCQELWYRGEWYTNPYSWNSTKLTNVGATYSAAYSPLAEYIKAWWVMMNSYRDMDKYQHYVDFYTAQIDSFIAQWEATTDPVKRSQLASSIRWSGLYAAQYQTNVDSAYTQFVSYSGSVSSLKSQADLLAAENMAAVAELRKRFPGDKNAISEIFMDAATGWGDGFNPYTDKYLCDFYRYLNGQRTAGEDYLPRHSIYYVNSKAPTKRELFYRVYVSPNGTMLASGTIALNYLRQYVLTYYQRKVRWRCETVYCEPAPCEFPDWGNIQWEDIHWSQNWKQTGLSGSVWAPLPVQDPALNGTDTYYLEVYWPISRREGVDNTAKQAQFIDMCNNWYDKHPRYDNRHEAYQ